MVQRVIYGGTADTAARCGSPDCPIAGRILRARGLVTPSIDAAIAHGGPYRRDPESPCR